MKFPRLSSAAAKSRRGFTLIELTIGLAVVGLLTASLFQLSTSGTKQLNDQLTAQQMQLWLKTAKAYLAAKGTDSSGASLYTTDAACTEGTTAMAAGATFDITNSVKCFRPNSLPATAAAGGAYTAMIKRVADTTSSGITYANYQLVISPIGTVDYDAVSRGRIATYIGAEGAATYDHATEPSCDSTNDNISGSFGNVCVKLSDYGTTFKVKRPATLSYVSMLNPDVARDNYLWRVSPPKTGLNEMSVNLGLQAAAGVYFNGNSALAQAGGIAGATGGITLDSTTPVANSIRGVSGGLYTNGGSVNTNGGAINTNAGNITTNGGAVDVGGFEIRNIGFMSFKLTNGTTGSITSSNDNIQIGGGMNINVLGTLYANNLQAQSFTYTSGYSSSDRRLKDHIHDLSNPLDKLMLIHGVAYRLKGGEDSSMGVLAQDVAKVYPELVRDRGDGYMAVNYNGLIAPMIESIRMLKDQNDRLEARVKVLEKQLRDSH